jgi:hypothetical protein
MPIEYAYDNAESVPEGYADLYSEKDGKFVLTGVNGIKTPDDTNKLMLSLKNERKAHATTKANLERFAEFDPEELTTHMAELEQLRLTGGKIDDSQIEELVGQRLTLKTKPLEKQIGTLTDQLGEAQKRVAAYELADTNRNIGDQLTKAATGAKVHTSALQDIAVIGLNIFELDELGNAVTREGIPNVTAGISPEVWLTEARDSRPHWWPESQNAGARGSGNGGSFANNPFTRENWNLTEQGKLLTANRARAEQMAKAAGTTIGGGMPAPKK